jgi:hypothetical protein
MKLSSEDDGDDNGLNGVKRSKCEVKRVEITHT